MILRAYDFEVDVDADIGTRFATLSGDWNPLHTDADFAKGTTFGKPLVHGAFTAGLVSRMAGMHLPGDNCLLHKMSLRFLNGIVAPVRLRVEAKESIRSARGGTVLVKISDTKNGLVYVDGSYDYGLVSHSKSIDTQTSQKNQKVAESRLDNKAKVLVTGTSGGIGSRLMEILGEGGHAIHRSTIDGTFDFEQLITDTASLDVSAVIHCAWPHPDSEPITENNDLELTIDRQVRNPLVDISRLAKFTAEHAAPGAMLLLVGSTWMAPGNHLFRSPFYSVAKTMIPTLVGALGVEFAKRDKRSVGIIFDRLDGGMNNRLSEISRELIADQRPYGSMDTVNDAAEQIVWVINNKSRMVSGSVIHLVSAAMP